MTEKTRILLKSIGNKPGVIYGLCKIYKASIEIVRRFDQYCWL